MQPLAGRSDRPHGSPLAVRRNPALDWESFRELTRAGFSSLPLGACGPGSTVGTGICVRSPDLVPDAPEDMRDVIADWDRIRMAIGGAVTDAMPAVLRLDQVTLRAPIPRPGKIVALRLQLAPARPHRGGEGRASG